MMNNIVKFLIAIIIFSFFIFTFNYYVSDKNISTVKNNRENLESKIFKSTSVLPLLPNDTNDVIEFNSGFDNSKWQPPSVHFFCIDFFTEFVEGGINLKPDVITVLIECHSCCGS